MDLDKLMKAEQEGEIICLCLPFSRRKEIQILRGCGDIIGKIGTSNECKIGTSIVHYSHCHCQAAAAKWSAGEESSETEDEDYQPDTEEETGVTSSYDDTSVTTGMSGQASEPTPKR